MLGYLGPGSARSHEPSGMTIETHEKIKCHNLPPCGEGTGVGLDWISDLTRRASRGDLPTRGRYGSKRPRSAPSSAGIVVSHRRDAAVHRNDGAGDERGHRRGEEQRKIGDLLLASHAPQGHGPAHAGLGL